MDSTQPVYTGLRQTLLTFRYFQLDHKLTKKQEPYINDIVIKWIRSVLLDGY